ncbi:DUF2254 domain-containing protein [Nakamurella endophytica]|nr:DUF2254 domain-containing protein [Nakamurella endophytica]
MTVQRRLTTVRDSLRTQLWPVPTAAVVLALVAGVLLPELDRAIDDRLPGAVTDVLFGGGASAARTLLDAIASSLITVTSLTFSLTVVTLQLASGQYSPRLLRTFTRDRLVHVTLGVFLATFAYALTVLRTVRSPDDDQPLFVPQISVTVGFVLAVGSVVVLVVFLAHLAREIRLETMVRNVGADASAAIDRLVPDNRPDGEDRPLAPGELAGPLQDAVPILASGSGFVTAVDHAALVDRAVKAEAVVVIDRSPGAFVVAGTPIGRVCRPTVGDREAVSDLARSLSRLVTVGVERTDAQDWTFGLRQLTDVTVRALSPGVNDPTTAVHTLGYTSALLCRAARRPHQDHVGRDDSGRVRLLRTVPTFEEVLDAAVTPVRRYGAADPTVLARLLQLLREVAWSAQTPDSQVAVADQLARVRATVRAQDFDAAELRQLDAHGRDVEQATTGRWYGPPSR